MGIQFRNKQKNDFTYLRFDWLPRVSLYPGSNKVGTKSFNLKVHFTYSLIEYARVCLGWQPCVTVTNKI